MKPVFTRLKLLAPLFYLLLFIAGMLAGCEGMFGDNSSTSSDITPTPTATKDPSGYQAVDPQACLVNQWNTLQSEQRRGGVVNWLQGDLLAWRTGQPAGAGELAFLSPSDRSSWFTGVLTLARGKDWNDRIILAPGVLANGDLTWAPDGAHLAFLAYRETEGLYTVMTVQADGQGLVDYFPGELARTDTRSAQKAIIGWRDSQTLQVMVSCGEECRSAYDINVNTPVSTAVTPTVIDDYTQLKANLQIDKLVLTVTPAIYPKNMLDPHWSPDQKLVAYLDKRGILWALSIPQKINYILDIGLRDVYEMQWSSASDALAIRAEDRVFVFQVPCVKK
jgi:hypothetical protein